MSTPVLATKLYIPPPRPNAIVRPRLLARLDAGLGGKLTLISAAPGSGKTTLLGGWLRAPRAAATSQDRGARRVAWLSLDAGDDDPARFLTHLIAALQTVVPASGAGALVALQAPQPPPAEAILTALLNELAGLAEHIVLVLDDYHVIASQVVDQALAFLLEHLPPQLHLIIATREDPRLPLARLRARGQLSELRAADLRFTPAEAAEFLSRTMGLSLSAEAIAALEARTEGWIAGLQLAALSIQGQQDAASFISSFTGGHHFVLDYLVEEVLHRQPEHVQDFLLRTSILERMCGPLCEAVLGAPAPNGQATLEYLEQANLFIVPLDSERRWYRYHHLFAELLRKRLDQQAAALTPGAAGIAALHVRASAWYEEHGLTLEAFGHAAAAHDVERAERLIDDKGMSRHSSSVVGAVLRWLATLPPTVLDARPSLWVRYAALLLIAGQPTGVEQKLHAAEAALQGVAPDAQTRDLFGRIAGARATLALTRYQIEAVVDQSRRALELLSPANLSFRASASWTLGIGYYNLGDRAAARQAIAAAVELSHAARDMFSTILATIALGQLQQADNQLHQAAATYRRVLQLAGDQPQQIVYEAQLGLAHICYEWNDLAAAEQHAQQGLLLARQYESVVDRFLVCEVFLARLKLAQGDVSGAAAMLAQAERSARERGFLQRMPEIADAQVLVLLRQGDLVAAEHLAQSHDLPLSRARVLLARGNAPAALALLEPLSRELEAKGWHDERLKLLALRVVALFAHGRQAEAVGLLGQALALAEPDGFIRLFVDEGPPMRQLLQKVAARGTAPSYARSLLAAFVQGEAPRPAQAAAVESLSERELEVLQHIAAGRTDQEIADRLCLSLYTVKVHARNIYGKLGVNKRTQAVARAQELGLLPHH